jgi:hypothetical protein
MTSPSRETPSDAPVARCVAHFGGRMVQAIPEVQHLPSGVVVLRFLRSGSGDYLFSLHMHPETVSRVCEDLGSDPDCPIPFEPTPSAGARDMWDDYPDKGDALLEVPR